MLYSFGATALLYLLLLGNCLVAYAQDEQQQVDVPLVVVVEGNACLEEKYTPPEVEKLAMAKAKRLAAERAATIVTSEVNVKDGKLIDDLINAYSEAAVTVLDVLGQEWSQKRNSKGGFDSCYKIRIKAKVTQADHIDKENQKYVDFVDLIELFSANGEKNNTIILPWETGGGENSPIEWETDGIAEAPQDFAEYPYCRYGTVAVSLDGEDITKLGKAVKPYMLDVYMLGVRGGFMAVNISSSLISPKIKCIYGEMAERHNVQSKVVGCDSIDIASCYTKGIEFQFIGKEKLWMIEELSCGSAGCWLSVTIHPSYSIFIDDLRKKTDGRFFRGDVCGD